MYDRLYDQDTILTDNDVIAAKLMADKLRTDGHYDEAAKIYELIQQKARASGRAVEGAEILSRHAGNDGVQGPQNSRTGRWEKSNRGFGLICQRLLTKQTTQL